MGRKESNQTKTCISVCTCISVYPYIIPLYWHFTLKAQIYANFKDNFKDSNLNRPRFNSTNMGIFYQTLENKK